MQRFESGAPLAPSPQAIEIMREHLHRMGLSLPEPAVRSLLEAVLAIEAARLHAHARVTLQSSLDSIRRTAESALHELSGGPAESSDLVAVVKEHLGSEPDSGRRHHLPEAGRGASGGRRPIATRRPIEEKPDDHSHQDPRPVFKRPRGR